jgi:hypothetical protein
VFDSRCLEGNVSWVIAAGREAGKVLETIHPQLHSTLATMKAAIGMSIKIIRCTMLIDSAISSTLIGVSMVYSTTRDCGPTIVPLDLSQPAFPPLNDMFLYRLQKTISSNLLSFLAAASILPAFHIAGSSLTTVKGRSKNLPVMFHILFSACHGPPISIL